MTITLISRLSMFALAASAALLPSAFAATLGDPAAPLAIKEWIKGQPVNVKDGKNVYVVEFWATWCGPCRFTTPHLTALQKKFKARGVVVVGISDEAPQTVKPFVQAMGTNMDYTIAIDDNLQSNTNYMAAYGAMGIPTAFVVGKDARVLWTGHPLMGLEEALEEILAGKYDIKAAGRRNEFRNSLQQYQQLAGMGDPRAADLARKLLPSAGDDVQLLSELATTLLTRTSTPDLALAEETLNKAIKLASEKDPRAWSLRAEKYHLLAAKADAKAGEFGRQVLADAGSESQALTDFAFRVATNMRVPNRDFALAEEALDKAAKTAGEKAPRILGIRGIAKFESGKQQEGLALAKQAVQLAKDDQEKAQYENFVRVMEYRTKQNTGGGPK